VFRNAAKATATNADNSTSELVSVIISAFNPDLELFELALGSILAQSHKNIEVFVVDDASEIDVSAQLQAICAAHKDVNYRRVPENSGPYIGRNLAIGEATGEFIAIQDADDWSHPQRLATQVAAFRASTAVQCVTCSHIRIDRAGQVQLEGGFAVTGDGPMTSMFRKSAFDSLGLFARVRSRGDIEMRERLISYFGRHALSELSQPMMLCLADSATLSQKTRNEKYEYLQLFRTNISSRVPLSALRRQGVPLGLDREIPVPLALRPPLPLTEA
jgi:glycosyltransferase involved in cell wall biosynthesis